MQQDAAVTRTVSDRLRGLYSRLLSIALLLLLALGLLGWLGGLLPALDVINHFRPWLLLASLTALPALWPAERGWRLPLAGVAAVALLLQAPFVLPTALASGTRQAEASDDQSGDQSGDQTGDQTGDQSGRELTLVTLNLRYANHDADPAARFLEATRPDLVFLQEVSPLHLASLRDRLAESLPYGLHCVERRFCNLAILSRFPLAAARASYLGWRPVPPPPLPPALPWQRVEQELPSESAAASGLQARALLPDGDNLQLFTVHLSWPIPAEHQRGQFRWIARQLERLPPGPTLLAGDFNSTPWSYGLTGFDALVPLTRATQGLFSFPAGLPLLPIDQVYASDDIAVEAIDRGPAVGSDHYPVVVRLRL